MFVSLQEITTYIKSEWEEIRALCQNHLLVAVAESGAFLTSSIIRRVVPSAIYIIDGDFI